MEVTPPTKPRAACLPRRSPKDKGGWLCGFSTKPHFQTQTAFDIIWFPEVENLLELHRQGKLTEHLAKEKERTAKERMQEN